MTSRNQRIVMACEFGWGSSGEGLAHGFRERGWEVTGVDIRLHAIPTTSIITKIATRGLRPSQIRSYNRAVLDSVSSINPDFFLTVKGMWLNTDTITQIRKKNINTSIYYPDFHFQHSGLNLKTFPLYDHFFTTKSFQVDYLKNKYDNIHFVHHGYSTYIHRPLHEHPSEDEYFCDVLYCGNYSPYKSAWLTSVARRLPNINLKIVGNRWEKAPEILRSRWVGRSYHGDRFASLIQRARINIAIHFGPEGPQGWEDLVSTRTFEIPACGGFMLHIDNTEVRELFQPGLEIDTFCDEAELCEKIIRYLKTPQKRREMINRAYQRCVPHYSYDQRAKAIAETLLASRVRDGGQK